MYGASAWLTARSTSKSRRSGDCAPSQRNPGAISGSWWICRVPKCAASRFPKAAARSPQDAVLSLGIEGDASTADRIVVDYEGLLSDVGPGDQLSFWRRQCRAGS